MSKDGKTLLIACYDDHSLVRLDLATRKEIETIRGDFEGPNDLTLDAHGGVYFSASGKEFHKDVKAVGKVYYLPPDGKPVEVANGIRYPNGLALTPDGKTLLVAEGLENRVLSYTVGAAGRLKGDGVWKRMSAIQPDPKDAHWSLGVDGLKVDSRGRVYLCQTGAGRILVTTADGTWLHTIPVPMKYVTNVAFGPKEKNLYVTALPDAEAEPYLGVVYEIPNR